MRIALAVLAIAAVMTAAPARGQVYDPAYPGLPADLRHWRRLHRLRL